MTSEAEALPEPPATGDAGIDAALAPLAALDGAALAEHPARLTRAHEILRAALQATPPEPLADEA